MRTMAQRTMFSAFLPSGNEKLLQTRTLFDKAYGWRGGPIGERALLISFC